MLLALGACQSEGPDLGVTVGDIEEEFGMDLEANVDYQEREPAVAAERLAIPPHRRHVATRRTALTPEASRSRPPSCARGSR